MRFARLILKQILWFLTKVAIRKHKIEFITVVGWYGTELVREGAYEVLSEKYNIRRNIQKISSDVSVPLNILGYKDQKYTVVGWLGIIFRSLFTLLIYPRNEHKFVLSLNLTQKSIADYWFSIIKPRILVLLNYKNRKSEIVDKIITRTKRNKGSIYLSDQIELKRLSKFKKFGYRVGSSNHIVTPIRSYTVSNKLPLLLLKIYAPINTIAEHYGWGAQEIVQSLAKVDASKLLLEEIIKKIEKE
jgi:hypothetical protein